MTDRSSLGQFEQLVLSAILILGDDAYGVTIHRGVEELMAPRRCQLGAVYATLDRVEDKGLVVSALTEPTGKRGGRARRCYTLTADGREALRESVELGRRLHSAVSNAWDDKPWSLA